MLYTSSRWLLRLTTQSLHRVHAQKVVKLCGRRGFASVTDLSRCPQPGESIHGFTLGRTKHVPELNLTAFHLEHEKTGAEYLHVARDDKNNVFSVGFKTNPPDDTGVPHILEHTTLCGSQKYPVRDPFFKMLPRSLSNFMNAMTYSDHTSYPFATTNQSDFQNLMSVYLDATLQPLLKENDFAQEGWRIGPENPLAAAENGASDQSSDGLVFKGVVYNEMKGQMSDASYLYYIRFQDHIFPDINNSGGDPKMMTDLTYQDLKNFHSKNYHPSNAKIFTYGDIPLQNHLQEISRRLNGFEKRNADTAIMKPRNLADGPFYRSIKGPQDPLIDKAMQYKTSTSWLMGDTTEIVETFALGIVSSLLIDGYGSPLYQALIEVGLGLDWSPNTGFDTSSNVGIFSVGLNGVRESDVPKVKEAIQSRLREVYERGFDKGKVDGILHQLELTLKHKTAAFGMGLMQRIQPGWFNGLDPLDALAWNDIVNGFKERYAKDGYLESLLEKYLLNDKTLTFTMEPSEKYNEDIASDEAKRLAAKISHASEQAGSNVEARNHFSARELELLEIQQNASAEDVSCLPSVHVKDVPRQMEKKALRYSSVDEIDVQWREADTNGLTYFRAINTLSGLPAELRMLIPLFTDSIMRLGTKDKTMEELEDLIKLKTGGINISYHSSNSPIDTSAFTEGLSFSGYSLDSNVPTLYEILRTILQETNFDGPEAESKIRQLLQADASGALDSVAGSGHSYARRYAEAGLSEIGLRNEQTSGLTQVQYTGDLANRLSTDSLQDIIEKLKAIQLFAVSNSSSFRAAITCEHEAASNNEMAFYKFLSHFPGSNVIPINENDKPTAEHQSMVFFPLPYQVYYSALALPTVPYVHKDGAPLQILAQLLTHKHLHHEIREKGGAYGGGAYSRGLSGLFGYYSYRDPNPQNTLKIMRDAGPWARDKDWTDQDLEEAKLSVFQSVDAPESVSQEGMTKFLSGVDESMEQTKREQLLDVKKQEVREVAQKYLVEGSENARLAVLGERKEWVSEAAGWTIKSMELSQASQSSGASDLNAGDLDHA